eukprot:6217677-Amphidinium_carterae.1
MRVAEDMHKLSAWLPKETVIGLMSPYMPKKQGHESSSDSVEIPWRVIGDHACGKELTMSTGRTQGVNPSICPHLPNMMVGRANGKNQWFTCRSCGMRWERVPYTTGTLHADRVMGFGKYAKLRYQETPLSYRVWAAKELLAHPVPAEELTGPWGAFATWCTSLPEVMAQVDKQASSERPQNEDVHMIEEIEEFEEVDPTFLGRSRQ